MPASFPTQVGADPRAVPAEREMEGHRGAIQAARGAAARADGPVEALQARRESAVEADEGRRPPLAPCRAGHVQCPSATTLTEPFRG